MSFLPQIDTNTLNWIITSGIIGIFVTVVVAAVKIAGRISTLQERVKNIDDNRISALEGRVKSLEENPFLVAVRQYHITQAEEMLKGYEVYLRNKLPKEKDKDKDKENEEGEKTS